MYEVPLYRQGPRHGGDISQTTPDVRATRDGCVLFSPLVPPALTRDAACAAWQVTVNIERTSRNSRRISGSIVVNRPIEVSLAY